MRVARDDEMPEWIETMRERARRDAETFVPRLGCPLYGLAAPVLTPALVMASTTFNDEWTSIRLGYGSPDSPSGPFISVTTAVAEPEMQVTEGWMRGSGPEAELRHEIERERTRGDGTAAGEGPAGADAMADADSLPVTRAALPAGPALVIRGGVVWAARLLPAEPAGPAPAAGAAPDVVVTIVGRGAAPESVLLTRLADVRPMIEARLEATVRRITQPRREPRAPQPPPPDFVPAEGVAALAALTEFTLASHAQLRDSVRARRKPQRPADWGRRHSALWQQAAREQQRLTGADARTADEAVTSAVNQLGQLAEQADWFGADPRLRVAAIDETLRRVMLGDTVASEPAQAAWTRSWSRHLTGLSPGPAAARAAMEAREALTADWLRAWAAWAAAR